MKRTWGFRELILSVKGDSVFSQLKFEAGVHRAAGPGHRIPGTRSYLHSHRRRDARADAVEVQLDPKD